MKKITIIGAGRVGYSIAFALSANGRNVAGIFSRRKASALRLARAVKAQNAGILSNTIPLSDTVIIAVPDSAIEVVVSLIAERKGSLKGVVFLHTSGALTSDELFPLKKKGASIGTIHPLQTFSRKHSATSFDGVYCAVEGDAAASRTARSISDVIGAKSFIIRKKDKVLYHIAAVFASNYLVTSLSAAEHVARRIGITNVAFRRIIRPLVMQTAENVLNTSPAAALTGPIKRGDGVTVTKHIRTLESSKQLKRFLPLYAALGMETAHLAQWKK